MTPAGASTYLTSRINGTGTHTGMHINLKSRVVFAARVLSRFFQRPCTGEVDIHPHPSTAASFVSPPCCVPASCCSGARREDFFLQALTYYTASVSGGCPIDRKETPWGEVQRSLEKFTWGAAGGSQHTNSSATVHLYCTGAYYDSTVIQCVCVYLLNYT